MASYGLSAGLGGSASRPRGTQECSPRLFTRAEEHTQRFRLGLRDFHAVLPALLQTPCVLASSLAQECVQRSLLALSDYTVTAGMKIDKTRGERI